MGETRHLRQTDPTQGSLQNAIPGIDIAALRGTGSERAAAVADIRQACVETGFFCIDNLLGRSSAYGRVLEQMQSFFARPDDDPVKCAIDVTDQENTNGWMPLFQEPAYQPGTVAHVESFDCSRPATADDDATHRANRWPAIADFRDDVQALWRELSNAGFDVLRGIAEAFDLESERLAASCYTQDLSTLRLLHYPPAVRAQQDPANVGIAAHTDFECITFIMQTAPGLELLSADGSWYDAPAESDRVVVLLGDMLERWTNGTVNATGHRVRSRDFRRYSVVLFFAVDDGVVVEPLAPFVSAANPAMYSPTDQRTHTRAELNRAETLRDEAGSS